MKYRLANWRRLLKVICVALVVLALLCLGFHLFWVGKAAKAREESHRAWAELGLALEGIPQSGPPQTDSVAAAQLVMTVADLGFFIGVQGDPDPTTEKARRRWSEVKDLLVDYIHTELERSEPSACAPPEQVAQYLMQHSTTLKEIRRQVREEAPRWRMDLSKGGAGDIPNLLGHIDLTRLLAADALTACAQGDHPRAVGDLSAIWRLSEGLEEHQELISQLILLAMRRTFVVSIRKCDGVPREWEQRILEWGPEGGLERSGRFEAVLWEKWPHPTTLGDLDPCGCPELAPGERKWYVAGGTLTFISDPYFRFTVAQTQLMAAGEIAGFRRAGLCPSGDSLAQIGGQAHKPPPWNLFARVELPGYNDAWDRAKQYRIQAELSAKVLTLKRLRGKDLGWPTEAKGIEQSFCTTARWVYTRAADGGMSLVLDPPHPPITAKKRGWTEPQEYRESATR